MDTGANVGVGAPRVNPAARRPAVVDTHAHLQDAAFDADRPAVIERAREAGLVAVVVVSENLADLERALVLAREHPLLRPAAGLYPGRAGSDLAERPAEGLAERLAEGVADRLADGLVAVARTRRAELVAIGEVGLDHWIAKDDESRRIQRGVFERFIDLALELDLPLNVHSRSAGREVIELLLARGARRVQMHAFDGRASTALPGLEAGFYFSVPPSLAHSQQKRKLVRALPLERLLLETDSPVLGPVPGERNEPANALLAAREIASIKDISLKAVLEAAYWNTRELYGDGVAPR